MLYPLPYVGEKWELLETQKGLQEPQERTVLSYSLVVKCLQGSKRQVSRRVYIIWIVLHSKKKIRYLQEGVSRVQI